MKGSERGRGIGAALIGAVVAAADAAGYWTVQAQILAANEASRHLHRKCGFREIGYRERLGRIGDVWHDVFVYERRSPFAGGPGLPTRTCGKS